MNIRRDPRKPKYWMIDTTIKLPDGTYAHLQKTGFETKNEAFVSYYQVLSDFLAKRDFKSVNEDVNKLIESYLDYQKNNLKISTFFSYKVLINKHILSYFKGMPLRVAFTQFHLSAFKKNIVKQTELSQDSKNKILRTLKSIGEFGYLRKLISPEAHRLILLNTIPIKGHAEIKKPAKIWTKDQYNHFISSLKDNNKYKVLYQWMFFSGARIGEVCALQWGDFIYEDVEVPYVIINKTASSRNGVGKAVITTTKTSAGQRFIYLSKKMFSQLLKLKETFGENPQSFMFFGGSQPIGYTTVRTVFQNYCRAAHLPVLKLHEIRHTNTTWLLSGEPTRDYEEAIKRRQGHESLEITVGTYFHHDSSKEKELAEKIEI